MALEVIHLRSYSQNGKGIQVCAVFATMFGFLADIATTINLLMMASGWTVTYLDMDWESLDIYLPMGAAVSAIHLVAGALIFVDDDGHHKFHDFAGYQGLALIVMKLVIFFYFLWTITTTKQEIPSKSQGFFFKFSIFAGVYLLSLPGSVLISYLYSPESRNFVITMGTVVLHTCSTAFLIYQ